jgi:metallothiol transferase
MHSLIANLVKQFENGRIDRRQLVAGLGTLVAVAAGGRSAAAQAGGTASTFQAVGLNHIALRVTDVLRSREFYQQHLGLKVVRDGGERNCFLTCKDAFLALFHNETPGMDHYCYSIIDYDVRTAEEKLKAQGFEPRVVRDAGRIYFDDPDGLEVQLAAASHRP